MFRLPMAKAAVWTKAQSFSQCNIDRILDLSTKNLVFFLYHRIIEKLDSINTRYFDIFFFTKKI